MSLLDLKDRLFRADYKPHIASLDVSFADLMNDASSRAAVIVYLIQAEADLGPGIKIGDFITIPPLAELGRDWSKRIVLSSYLDLAPDERAEVLLLLTFDLHELTHHIDLLATPFGANFHCRASNEYIALQSFVPELLATPGDGLGLPLVNWTPPESGPQQDELIEAWSAVRGKFYYFDTLRGSQSRFISPGWLDKTEEPFEVLGWHLKKVCVRDLMLTVEIPEHSGAYLRPLTILESRALAHSLRHILRLFGGDELACDQAKLYMEAFYPRTEIAPDYTFLLDVLARENNEENFEAMLRRPAEDLSRFLNVVSAVGWYALQAPPIRERSAVAVVHSSPVVRWLYGLQTLHELSRDRETPFNSNGEMLDAIDGYREDAWRPPPIETNITAAIKYVAETRARTQAENYDEEMRAHFDTLLGALEAHLTARLKEGNESDLGMPLSGSPGFVCSVASMNWEGPGLYRAVARSVKEWFALRDNLLFRIVPSVADRRRFLGQRFALL